MFLKFLEIWLRTLLPRRAQSFLRRASCSRYLFHFLRTGSQDREYSFAEVFCFFSFFCFFFFPIKKFALYAGFFFSTIHLKNLMGHDVLNFSIFVQVFELTIFSRFFVKSIGLCQLLQLSTDFDEIFRIYSLKLGMIQFG